MASMTPLDYQREPAIHRLKMKHPIPWRYEFGAIYDADGALIIKESGISQEIFDMIWVTYVLLMRPTSAPVTSGP